MINRLKDGQMRPKALEMGIAVQQDFDEMIEGWEEWMETEDAMLAMINGTAIITRSPDFH